MAYPNQAANTQQRFKTVLTNQEFGVSSASNTILQANRWTLVLQYTVPAQQEIAIGYDEVAMGANQGAVAYIRLDDTANAQMTAEKFRIVVTDANNTRNEVVHEDTGDRWAASTTDRTTAKLLPEDFRHVGQDSLIQIWVYTTKTGAAFQPGDADTKIILPCTRWMLRR
jgi:hypothetical protein